jgi:HlyD family secretion protein
MKAGGWLTTLVVLGAAGGGWWWWSKGRGPKPPPVKFDTGKVDRGAVVAKVTASGTLSAVVTVQVGSQVSGRIAELHADFNDRVEKGQVLAVIDRTLFLAAVEQAKANHAAAHGDLTKAKAQATQAQKALARTRTLARRDLVATADLDEAEANAAVASASVASAAGRVQQTQAALRQAEANLSYTTIVSPITGTVIQRNVDVGQTVAAAMQAPVLFNIAEDLAHMQVDTSVAEADIGKLRDGMEASFTVDAWPGERFKGRIRQIRNAPQTVQNVVTYDAVLDVQNLEAKLRPGMTANVAFVYAERKDVMRVPNAALRFRPPADVLTALGLKPELGGAGKPGAWGGNGGGSGGNGGGSGSGGGRRAGGKPEGRERQVWRLDGSTPVSLSVQVSVTDGTFTEIGGEVLKEGDTLVLDAQLTEPKPAGSSQQTPGGPMRRVF